MVLSNQEINYELAYGDLEVTPATSDQVQPASIDLRLSDEFVIYEPRPGGDYTIDSRNPEDLEHIKKEVTQDEIKIRPNHFYLATTKEDVTLPNYLYGQIAGRSSIGRLGVAVHETAGVIDPGWDGQITLEISTQMPHPVKLYEGQRVAQMTLHETGMIAKPGYGDKDDQKYQGQRGPTESRAARDKDQ